MGQSVLSYLVTQLLDEGVKFCSHPLWRKGIGLIFPNLSRRYGPFWAQRGNATERGDVGGGSRKSSLFFVKSYVPGMCLPRDRDAGPVKHRGSCGVGNAFVGP